MKTRIGKVAGSNSRWVLFSIAMLGLIGCAGNTSSTSSNVGITAATESVRTDETTTFEVEGIDPDKGKWSVVGGAKNGTIDQTGLYHAPSAIPQPSSISISYSLAGKSYTHSIQILNPVPNVEGSVPNIVRMALSTVSITGSKFVPGANVLVNGQVVPTSFIKLD